MGVHGIGLIPIWRQVSVLGGVPLDFGYTTFTASLSKRATSVFAASPIIQGAPAGDADSDQLYFARGAADSVDPIRDSFYGRFDAYQGTIVLWYTPEFDSEDLTSGQSYLLYAGDNNYLLYDWEYNRFEFFGGSGAGMYVSHTLVAGTRVFVAARWDTKRTIDGTNYLGLTVNSNHSYGGSTKPTVYTLTGYPTIGAPSWSRKPPHGIVEGLTIYRRVVFDGTYGDAARFNTGGPVDELSAMHASGSGQDPCLMTGSWDTVACVPTDCVEGQLATGSGNAWSHPHVSNLLNRWMLDDAFYGGGQWAVAFNGTSTTVNCGSGATLDDIPDGSPFTVEGWFRADSTGEGDYGHLVCKGGTLGTVSGWRLYIGGSSTQLAFQMDYDATDINHVFTISEGITDGKWHHIAVTFDGSGAKTATLWLDGRSRGTSSAASGNYVSDAAHDCYIGADTWGNNSFDGAIGWVRLSDSIRYSASFVPAREFPATDGNTVEQWSFDDGTGTTIVASVTTPGNDGTLSNGTWQQQWDDVLTPVIPTSLEFDGAATYIDGGSGATIDDLPTGANGMTFECWMRTDSLTGDFMSIAIKGAADVGWTFYHNMATNAFAVNINYDSADASMWHSVPFAQMRNGTWHHLAFTYNESGDRKVRFFVDGILVNTGSASAGNYQSDASASLFVGRSYWAAFYHDGCLGWTRLSSTVRYSANFAPPSRVTPPGIDGNTELQWNMTDGAGTTATDTSGNANHGAITLGTGRWWKCPDMAADSPGSRIHQWGFALGSDAANDGVHQHKASLTAGANYVARIPVRYEADKVARPSVIIYDETNGAAISTFKGPFLRGTHDGGADHAHLHDSTAPYWPFSLVGGTVYNITDGSSGTITGCGTQIDATLSGGTDNNWDNDDVYMIVPPTGWVWAEPFTFELPTTTRNGVGSDCTHISARLLNGAGDGVVYWQQIELLVNLVDNPSLETGTGNPWIADGWTNEGLDSDDSSQETTVVHSGSSALRYNAADLQYEGIYQQFAQTGSGAFYALGAALHGNGTQSPFVQQGGDRLTPHNKAGTSEVARLENTASCWLVLGLVGRTDLWTALPQIYSIYTFTAPVYTDDVFYFPLETVGLTATPTSEANSAETAGLRIDGHDAVQLTVPTGYLFAARGWLRWKWKPRHGAAEFLKFGSATRLPVLAILWGDSSNCIFIDCTANNTMRMYVNANGSEQSQTWDCTGQIVTNVAYLVEVRWEGGWFGLFVNGTLRIQCTPGDQLVIAPITVLWGHVSASEGASDAVYAKP